ncbi:hypothetical protein V6N13_015013 [Hibiscus sabdariffa]|uniref:F-box associated domain-containing protein n=1 Tax=Hibiscus sabdariffa TaxID=183260 RepID=A0ABR2RXI1_9ROSI
MKIHLSTNNQQNLHLPDKDEGFEERVNPHSRRFDFETIGVLGGNLCAIDSFDWRDYVGIWVMNKYGVKESWTWLFSIPFVTCKNSLGNPDVHPLMYSQNGEEVLVGRGGGVLFYYNLKMWHIKLVDIPILDMCIRHVDIPTLGNFGRVQICHQSLIPLNFE